MYEARARREAAVAAAHQEICQSPPVIPSASAGAGAGSTSRAVGVPCLIPALRNERLPKDFKGPRKVPNYTADLPPEAWIESYELAMEMLDVSDAVCAKYFIMMLEGPARTWLKGLPPNSINTWAELKARFIKNFHGTCKQPMTIVDLDHCVQREDESAHHWVRRVSTIIHSSDNISAAQAVLILEKNCHFVPLKQKLGRLKRSCQDMGELMAALTKYADSDSTKDPSSDDEKAGKGKKNGNGKGQSQNPAGNNNQGKRKNQDGGSELVANTNTGGKRRNGNGKPPFGGPKPFNLEAMLSKPCPEHSQPEKPATHAWKDCYIMREFRNYSLNQHHGSGNGPPGGSGSGSQGGGFGGLYK